MTKQEYKKLLIDTSAAGMFPSVRDGQCAYRGDDGRKCAIGVAIPDSVYDPSVEGWGIPDVIYIIDVIGVTKKELSKCQYAHDTLSITGWNHEAFVRNIESILGSDDESESKSE